MLSLLLTYVCELGFFSGGAFENWNEHFQCFSRNNNDVQHNVRFTKKKPSGSKRISAKALQSFALQLGQKSVWVSPPSERDHHLYLLAFAFQHAQKIPRLFIQRIEQCVIGKVDGKSTLNGSVSKIIPERAFLGCLCKCFHHDYHEDHFLSWMNLYLPIVIVFVVRII